MTTVSRQWVRALLHGCHHKPKFSAMHHPKKNDVILCHPCNRSRIVLGLETGWKYATVGCTQCSWKYQSETAGKKKMFGLAHNHADARGHLVRIECDGRQIDIPAKVGYQPPLVDDLLLPD